MVTLGALALNIHLLTLPPSNSNLKSIRWFYSSNGNIGYNLWDPKIRSGVRQCTKQSNFNWYLSPLDDPTQHAQLVTQKVVDPTLQIVLIVVDIPATLEEIIGDDPMG